MANVKITDLTALSGALADADLFEMVDDPAGTPLSRKVTAAVVRSYMLTGHITGMLLSYSSTTAVVVSSGTININGTIRSYTGATYTSGSTMKDMANATVTLGASKAYHVFAYNNAGTVEVRFEDIDGTGDGDTPVFDDTLDYWKAASTGAEARRIGKIWTTSGSALIDFAASGRGRNRAFLIKWANNVTWVSNSAAGAASYQAITTTPQVDGDDDIIHIEAGAKRSTGTGIARILISVDSTNEFLNLAIQQQDTSSVALGRGAVPNTGTLHYQTAANVGGTVKFGGVEMFV